MKKGQQKEQIVYMDRESYVRYLADLDKLIEEKKAIDRQGSEVHKKGTDFAWDNTEFMYLEGRSNRYAAEIKRRRLNLANIVILNHQDNEELVDFGDVLRLSLYDQYGNDEIIGKLVGDAHPGNENSEYVEISGNGLIGALIYGKKVGETISYVADDITCYVQIVEKLNNKKEEKETCFVKKLERKDN